MKELGVLTSLTRALVRAIFNLTVCNQEDKKDLKKTQDRNR